MKDLYNENYRTLKKEIKEELGRWKDLPCPWIGRINIVNNHTTKSIIQISCNSTKIPMVFCIELEKAIMKFTWKNKRPIRAKANHSKKSWAGSITMPDLKVNYRTIVSKTTWYCHHNRHIDQCYRIENTETNSYKTSTSC